MRAVHDFLFFATHATQVSTLTMIAPLAAIALVTGVETCAWIVLLFFLSQGINALFLKRFNVGGEIKAFLGVLFPTARMILIDKLRLPGAVTMVENLIANARNMPTREALIFTADERRFTWMHFNEEVNKVANYLVAKNVKAKSIVAIMMENSPEFLFFIMATMKVGAIPALINTNLRGSSLSHVLKASGASRLIFSTSLSDRVDSARSEVESFIKSFDAVGDSSGTTGLPKPAILSNYRTAIGPHIFASFAILKSYDRIYNSGLPLYHSAALIVGWGVTLALGGTLVLAPKFSARKFCDDVENYRCDVAQYIGELARFVVNYEEKSGRWRKKLHLRVAVGNGLKKDVWTRFMNLGIAEVTEFFAATEGNANLAGRYVAGSIDGLGAVGRMGPILASSLKIHLVKFDPVTESPVRDEIGRCVVCKAGEVGELISEIQIGHFARDFKGYYGDKNASQKKILRDVFREGDMFYRTGDIFTRDSSFFYYFVDRIGDSFRWKGENVSTTEVENAVSLFSGISEAIVYGVEVPHAEGRAGCAALRVIPTADISALRVFLNNKLPKFAVPVFLRIISNEVTSDSHTGTFKAVKFNLKKEGVNPTIVKDQLYWIDPEGSERDGYKPFRAVEWGRVKAGIF